MCTNKVDGREWKEEKEQTERESVWVCGCVGVWEGLCVCVCVRERREEGEEQENGLQCLPVAAQHSRTAPTLKQTKLQEHCDKNKNKSFDYVFTYIYFYNFTRVQRYLHDVLCSRSYIFYEKANVQIFK